MASFQIEDGTRLTVEVDTVVIEQLREDPGVDLAAVFTSDVLQRIHNDPVLLVNTLYVCCKRSCEKAEISDEDFGRQLAKGESIAAATACLLEAIVNFTPPQRRPALMAAIAKIDEIEKKESELAIERINSPAIDKILTAQHQSLMNELDDQAEQLQAKSDPQSTDASDDSN